jgi:hypothetical protein
MHQRTSWEVLQCISKILAQEVLILIEGKGNNSFDEIKRINTNSFYASKYLKEICAIENTYQRGKQRIDQCLSTWLEGTPPMYIGGVYGNSFYEHQRILW